MSSDVPGDSDESNRVRPREPTWVAYVGAWARARVTRELAVSRARLTADQAQLFGLRRWFARLHWVLVVSVATTQLLAFTVGVGPAIEPGGVEQPAPSRLAPLRRPARPNLDATATRATASECPGIRLGEVLVDAEGKPVFATLSESKQVHAFPRRIGDRLAGSWEVNRLSVTEGTKPSQRQSARLPEAQVELKSGNQSCTLATRRVRLAGYSAAL